MMQNNIFTDSEVLEGVVIRRASRFDDERGWLAEFFRHDEIADLHKPVMGYTSLTRPGKSRGPHEHVSQTDYFFFPGIGEFVLILWDARKDSSTYQKRLSIRTEEDVPLVAIIPPGIVHAYHCTSKTSGLAINIPNKLFKGEHKKNMVDEIRHENGVGTPYAADFHDIIGKL